MCGQRGDLAAKGPADDRPAQAGHVGDRAVRPAIISKGVDELDLLPVDRTRPA